MFFICSINKSSNTLLLEGTHFKQVYESLSARMYVSCVIFYMRIVEIVMSGIFAE